VEVRIRIRPEAVQVEVADNGPGLRPEEQEIVFEKFRQAGDALIDKPKGTGLGLPISREIITRLGGEIWVESRPGAGATFAFTLPVARSEGRPEAVAGKRGAGEDPDR
jgi:signal transduction histidine kinase